VIVRREGPGVSASGPGIDYVLPLKWDSDDELPELTTYLQQLSEHATVIVVDGSPERVFAAHAEAWRGIATHVRPVGSFINGKVSGVDTGLRLATNERVVIADDDVRYTPEQLQRAVGMLAHADLVGPQNVFDELPWHARWDTARTLLNRAVAADYPGTFAIRRSTYLAMGGYDGDVMFENLELMRTVRAWGGRVLRPLDLYVVRRPPEAARFLDQRVRQAYDDLCQPWRMATFLSVLPAAAWTVARGKPQRIAYAAGAVVAMAEVGRRRAGGAEHFPPSTPLFAPLWVGERALCSWLALKERVVHGGVRYRDGRLRVAAHGPWTLRRRLRGRLEGREVDGGGLDAGSVADSVALGAGPSRRTPGVAGGSAEADRLVGAVAERLERAAPAPAQRDGAPAEVDLVAVGRLQAERSAHDQRPVGVRRDGDKRIGTGIGTGVGSGGGVGHLSDLSARRTPETAGHPT
jgi:hypothetical protein